MGELANVLKKILLISLFISGIIALGFSSAISETKPKLEDDNNSLLQIQTKHLKNLNKQNQELERQLEQAKKDLQAKAEAKAKQANAIKKGCRLAFNYSNWDSQMAYAVCMAESGGNYMATNAKDNHYSWAKCYGSYGLFQINCSYGKLYDPIANVATANKIYTSWGNSFSAWTTCQKIANCK